MHDSRSIHQAPRLKRQAKPNREEVERLRSLYEEKANALGGAAEMLLHIARKRPAEEEAYRSILLTYRAILSEMGALRPELALWQIERDALPDHIKNQTLWIPPLPETPVPFSPSGCWINEPLEIEFGRSVNGADDQSACIRRAARILDRYVQCSFPLDRMHDLYRPPVLKLSRIRDESPGAYISALLYYGAILAAHAIPSLLSGNANLLKMSLHNFICTQTGVPLTETHSAPSRHSYLRLRRTSVRIPSDSFLGRAGFSSTLGSISRTIVSERGFNIFEGLREEKPPICRREDILAFVEGKTMRAGKGAVLTHPDLPGIELTEAECDAVAKMVVDAQNLLLASVGIGQVLPSENEWGVNHLKGNPSFLKAFAVKDAKTLMQLGIETWALIAQSGALSLSLEDPESLERVRTEVDRAVSYSTEYLEALKNPDKSTATQIRGVRRMIELSKEQQYAEASPFVIALAVIDEMNARHIALKTMRPPADSSLPPAPPSLAEDAITQRRDIVADTEEEITGEMPVPSGFPGDEGPAVEAPAAEEDERTTTQLQVSAGPPARTMLDEPVETMEEPEEELTVPGVRLVPTIFNQLMEHEKELVAGVMEKAGCDETVLDEFMRLPPAMREFLIEAFIASRWTHGDWRKDLEKYRSARESLCRQCNLAAPSKEEKLEFILNPDNLTLVQQVLVSSLFGIPEHQITRTALEGFRVWVSSDPSTPSGKAALGAFWDANLNYNTVYRLAQKVQLPGARFSEKEISLLNFIFDIPPGKNVTAEDIKDLRRIVDFGKNLQSRQSLWFDTPLHERRRFWRNGSVDIMAAGLLTHSLRFGRGGYLSPEELQVLSTVCEQHISDVGMIDPGMRRTFAGTLAQHTYKIKTVNSDTGEEEVHEHYYPEILRIALHGQRQTEGSQKFNLSPMMRVSSLRLAARKEAEFRLLLDFLGLQVEAVRGMIDHRGCHSRAKTNSHGQPYPNDDSVSRVKVLMPDGSRITASAVCDGMGGHNQGNDGGKTNGQIASGIAKDVFEISALAGWLRTPEDVRKVIFIADLTIIVEQIGRKASKDDLRENDMGTTMTVCFQHDDKCWFIHSGDSDGRILRGGRFIFATEGHSSEYATRLHQKAEAESEITANWRQNGADPEKLDPGWRKEFEKQVRERTKERMDRISGIIQMQKNAVASALGAFVSFVHINNSDDCSEGIQMRGEDVVVLNSDGIISIHDLEFPLLIGQNQGDLDQAAKELISIAEGRRGTGPHPTLIAKSDNPAEFIEIEGKRDDDKSIIMYYAQEGFSRGAVSKNQSMADLIVVKVEEEPRVFASSPEFRRILDHAVSRHTPKEDVLELFDAFILGAEGRPGHATTDPYTVAIASVFHIAAGRPDREELIDELVPRIESWSGLIMKKLRNSPDASPRKRAMFDLVSRVVPHNELESLLQSKNKEICGWTAEFLNSVRSQQIMIPQELTDTPQSLFNSQTDPGGRPLDARGTRYLSDLVDIYETAALQEIAEQLKILPRDLEVMVFYAFSDFRPEAALEPHKFPEGDDMICNVLTALNTEDSERILLSSYIIYRLRNGAPEPGKAGKMVDLLWKQAEQMDKNAPYRDIFMNEARRLKVEHFPDGKAG